MRCHGSNSTGSFFMALAMLAMLASGLVFSGCAGREPTRATESRAASIDLASIEDGMYLGEQWLGQAWAGVMVRVQDHGITRVNVFQNRVGRRPRRAELIADRVIAAQSLEVEPVAEARASGELILRAIENALRDPVKSFGATDIKTSTEHLPPDAMTAATPK